MRKILLLPFAVAILALMPTQRAHADLVTFAFNGQFGRGDSCLCTGFESETGLLLPGPYKLTALFTADPTAYTGLSADALVDSPGTGLGVTVGDLTLFYSPYTLFFSEQISLGSLGSCDAIGVTGPGGATQSASFSAWNCDAVAAGKATGFSGGGLQDFATHSLSSFTQGPGVEDSIVSPAGGSDWFLEGTTTGIHAVPEPSTLALFGIGLVGLGFMRWRKAS